LSLDRGDFADTIAFSHAAIAPYCTPAERQILPRSQSIPPHESAPEFGSPSV
jgi:hypothetical protein